MNNITAASFIEAIAEQDAAFKAADIELLESALGKELSKYKRLLKEGFLPEKTIYFTVKGLHDPEFCTSHFESLGFKVLKNEIFADDSKVRLFWLGF